MSLMARRRALMGAQRDKIIPLQNVPVGALVKFGNSYSYNLINVGVVDGISLLLREKTLVQRSTGKSTAGNIDYDTSTLDNYLMGSSFYGSYPTSVKNVMRNFSVTYNASDGTNIVERTIQRKIFIPTRKQSIATDGVDGVVLAALKIFKNTDVASTARIAKNSSGTDYSWSIMDAVSTSKYYYIYTDGTLKSNASYNQGGVAPRPLFAIDKTVPTKLQDGIYVCQL